MSPAVPAPQEMKVHFAVSCGSVTLCLTSPLTEALCCSFHVEENDMVVEYFNMVVEDIDMVYEFTL